MDFNLPGENDPRRTDVRRWFDAHPSPTYRQLAEQGFVSPHWPRPWGLEAEPELQLIIDEEIARAGIAHPMTFNPMAINQCGQSLLKWGTEAQRQQFLPRALACEQLWCMLFSEPSGGSDLSAVRTTARRDGDHYVVNGQKSWNSIADKAHIGVLVARTNPQLPKHQGLSQLLIDMNAPGVTVRPIIDMSGQASEYNEVFLENVRVPADRLIGKEGDGWKITIEQLQTERAAMTKPGAVWGSGPTARDLVDGLIATGRIADPLLADEAVKLYVEGELLRLLSLRGLTSRITGRPAGMEANVGKMISSPHGQKISDLAKRSQGVLGMIRNPDVLPVPKLGLGLFDNWDYAYWFSPATTLGVGTQEILKNTIAERLLGLPKDVDPTARQPFNEIGKAPRAAE